MPNKKILISSITGLRNIFQSPTCQYWHRSNQNLHSRPRLVGCRIRLQTSFVQRDRCQPGHVYNQYWYIMTRVNVDTVQLQNIGTLWYVLKWDTCTIICTVRHLSKWNTQFVRWDSCQSGQVSEIILCGMARGHFDKGDKHYCTVNDMSAWIHLSTNFVRYVTRIFWHREKEVLNNGTDVNQVTWKKYVCSLWHVAITECVKRNFVKWDHCHRNSSTVWHVLQKTLYSVRGVTWIFCTTPRINFRSCQRKVCTVWHVSWKRLYSFTDVQGSFVRSDRC